MKELKFNKEMKRAKDEGRKTQTRRVLEVNFYIDDYTYQWIPDFDAYNHLFTNKRNSQEIAIQCPYGKVGDINNGCLITDIRVERLQDISEEDAIAEGVEKYGPFGEHKGSEHPNGGSMRYRAYQKASRAFQCIWESIYPNHPTKAWRLNPYVWVITFENVEQ